MHIGSVRLSSNLCLAPLAGYTTLAFRLCMRELGGFGLATTELVHARALLEQRPKAFALAETCPEDAPLSVQLFGPVAEEVRDAALYLQERGADLIDINMGCPVEKVVKIGAGAAMLKDPQRTARFVRTITTGGPHSGHGQNAPGLGRDAARRDHCGASSGRCRCGGADHSRPNPGRGVWRQR